MDIGKANLRDMVQTPISVETQEQKNLEEALEIINNKILELNKIQGDLNIKTHKHVIVGEVKGKGAKKVRLENFRPKNLYDGVHPDKDLDLRHFRHITNIAKKQWEERINIPDLEVIPEAENTTAPSETLESQCSGLTAQASPPDLRVVQHIVRYQN